MSTDIDAIFASSKGKAKLTSQPAASSSNPSKPLADAKKKKKTTKTKADAQPHQKKRRCEDDAEVPALGGDPSPSVTTKKPKVAETVVDPSLRATASSQSEKPVKRRTKDEKQFKDSRGNGPRRKTEEGFLVYKEDELGITDQGGDTHLCPFDCQCCF
ncbi:hypothetical protein EIP91_001428 [Steccherinum ochraceum]|uniref:DUF1764 domain-containing protein n=1 Tax=Steccherinum ochraceum TaxID=92696 RepID=A0A4R0RMH0_9APHY|nr:hypothetical protein EIP91_001428 [Steccherinum ochraceum]